MDSRACVLPIMLLIVGWVIYTNEVLMGVGVSGLVLLIPGVILLAVGVKVSVEGGARSRERKGDEKEPEVRMPFPEHLRKLPIPLFKSIGLLLVVIVALGFVYEKMVLYIVEPHFKAMELLGKQQTEVPLLPGGYEMPLVQILKMNFILGLFFCSPFIGYQLWAFVGAGLLKREKKYVVWFAPISIGLFIIGCVFGFTLLLPYALWGLADMTDFTALKDGKEFVAFNPNYSFSSYLSFVMLLTTILGGFLQIPLFMAFFAKIGLVHPNKYCWPGVIIALGAILIVAVVITPADLVTAIVAAVPLLCLYVIGVISSFLLILTKGSIPLK